MTNIHASCVSWQNKGILIVGKSGIGKSDLCLRLIQNHHALLVADDRVDLNVSHETIIASSPPSIKGMLEVRGVGILKTPHVDSCNIDIVIKLVSSSQEIERLPQSEYWEFEGIKLPLIHLNAFETSATSKIIAVLSWPKVIK